MLGSFPLDGREQGASSPCAAGLSLALPASFLGRVFSNSQVQHVGEFGVNERVESFASTAGGFEAALKSAGVAFGLWVFLARAINRRIGQADDDASNRS